MGLERRRKFVLIYKCVEFGSEFLFLILGFVRLIYILFFILIEMISFEGWDIEVSRCFLKVV